MYRSRVWIFALVIVSFVGIVAEGAVGNYTAKRVLIQKHGADGSEEKVPAVEFAVTSDRKFEVRALHYVLSVGKLRMTKYRWGNMENTMLIFTCFEPDKLEDDVPVFVQYAGDPTSRIELPRFRLSMIQPL